MRKLTICTSLMIIFLCGCNSNISEISSESVLTENTYEESVIEPETQSSVAETIAEESSVEEMNFEDSEVILKAHVLNGITIEEYVNQLNEKNPGKEFSVYDSEHYSYKMTGDEKKEAFANYETEKIMRDATQQLVENEQLGGAILEIVNDNSYQNFKVYVDKEKFEEKKFLCSLGCSLSILQISDAFQAINDVMPEDRITNIQYIDKNTGLEIEL